MKSINRIYHKTCIVCDREFTSTQASAKTCKQKCRNALSYGRKIIGVADKEENVITPVTTPVITPGKDIAPINKFISFNMAEIHEELKKQNINSIKSANGAYMLYEYIQLTYKKGENIISEEIFSDCGINPKDVKEKSISIGEFLIEPQFSFSHFILHVSERKYRITRNETINKLKYA